MKRIIFLFLFLPSSAFAQEAQMGSNGLTQQNKNSQQESPEYIVDYQRVEDINHPIARVLTAMKHGQWVQANEIASSLRQNKNLTNNLHLLFLSGQIAEQLAQFGAAKKYYQLMLDQQPNLERPRFEIAKMYAAQGERLSARYHLDYLLKTTQDKRIKSITQEALKSLNRPRYEVGANMYALPSNNINQGSQEKTVNINGYEFELSEQSQAQSGVGLGFGLQGRVYFGKNYQAYAGASYQMNDRRGKSNDNDWRSLSLGYVFKPTDNNKIDCHIGPAWQYFQHKLLAKGVDLACSGEYTQAKNTWLYSQGVQRFLYEKPYTHLQGNTYSSRLGWKRPLVSEQGQDNHIIGLSINREDYQAKSKMDTNKSYGLTANYDVAMGMWLFNTQLNLSKTEYGARNPFFAKIRQDKRYHASFGLTHRRLSFFGVNPYLQFNYVNKKSNIPLYTYNEAYVNLNIRKVF